MPFSRLWRAVRLQTFPDLHWLIFPLSALFPLLFLSGISLCFITALKRRPMPKELRLSCFLLLQSYYQSPLLILFLTRINYEKTYFFIAFLFCNRFSDGSEHLGRLGRGIRRSRNFFAARFPFYQNG